MPYLAFVPLELMYILHGLYCLIGTATVLSCAGFASSSFRERRVRAGLIGLILSVLLALWWFEAPHYFPTGLLPGLNILAVGLAVLIWYLPIGRVTRIAIGKVTERVDERDTMFARDEYQPGTEKFDTYYAMRPEHRESDDRFRALPEFLSPGGRFYDPDASDRVRAIFETIASMATSVDGPVSEDVADHSPELFTSAIKRLVRDLGADEVGVAALNPMFVYSHVGRGPEPWGAPIENHHRFAVMFTVEMRYEQVDAAPTMPITEESATQYLRAANISVAAARYIRSLGYSARAHISDSNYQIMMPPVAHDAGLGELGRLGYLISPRFGARIRLGGITTDLPLIPDKPIAFGVQDFCAMCKKCAVNCPSHAIPFGDKAEVRGVSKWLLDSERCFHYWRVAGTDCGLCMKVCPFSHPDTFFHDLVRHGIKRSPQNRQLAAWGDDICYGRTYRGAR